MGSIDVTEVIFMILAQERPSKALEISCDIYSPVYCI